MASVAPIRDRPLRILMVESNPADVLLMRIAFKERSSQVELYAVSDGQQAMDRLAQIADAPEIRPDLILLDLNLPKLSGHEVLKSVKSDRRTASIPVIIFSSSRLKEDV